MDSHHARTSLAMTLLTVARSALAQVLFALGLALCASGAELEQREPKLDAPAHKYFAWTSEGGLRYAWRLPRDLKAGRPVHLTVICHGTGLDHRWGPANHPSESFRPLDIVVSLDGPTPAGESRLFMGEPDDVESVAAVLSELRQRLPIDAVFLYGHSQGGFFVAHYAGERPQDVAGVVAHASGSWAQTKMAKTAHKVAHSFLHGTADPVVPFVQSVGARDHYVESGYPLVRLRRLERYNHWPNAVRAGEELDWCQGMTTADAAEALACAERILAPKPADEYQWSTAVGFDAARAVLERLLGRGPASLPGADAATQARARELLGALDEHVAKHCEALRKALGKNRAMALDGGEWLGHLAALREDCRGFEALEALAAELEFDKRIHKHSAAARKLRATWYSDRAAAKKYEELVDALPGCYLIEWLPPELVDELAKWREQEKQLGASKKTSKGYEAVEQWKKGWSEGYEAYARLWRKWKPPVR